MNHTPGPWQTVHEGHRLSVWAEGYGFVHTHEVPAVNVSATATANANSQLIAAAPELLEYLKILAYWIEQHPIDAMPPSHLVNAKNVITKAEGA